MSASADRSTRFGTLAIGASVGACVLMAWLFGLRPAAMAQQPLFFEPVVMQQRGPGPQGRAQGRGAGARRPAPPLPPQMLERLKNLPPEERERVLENNRRFRQLPPERQEQLRARLRELQELTPEQRELIEQRFAIFSNLTPQQQERARQIYERRWRQISAERRRALMAEFRRLRAMDQAERQQRLESEDLRSQFDAEERNLLAQLISL